MWVFRRPRVGLGARCGPPVGTDSRAPSGDASYCTYAGDRVKGLGQEASWSSRSRSPSKIFWPRDLSLVLGVVALGLQGGSELDGGDEEGAAFADRLEVAVGLDGPGAVAVAEHSAVHLCAELAHFAAFVVTG